MSARQIVRQIVKQIVGKKSRHWQKNSSFFANLFSSDKVLLNPIRPGSRQINARQFKMTAILERYKALLPYLMNFSF